MKEEKDEEDQASPEKRLLLANMHQLGRMMELLDRRGLEMVVRVIPDPAKDIGFNILSIFHYPHHPQIVTCGTMMEAAKLLLL